MDSSEIRRRAAEGLRGALGKVRRSPGPSSGGDRDPLRVLEALPWVGLFLTAALVGWGIDLALGSSLSLRAVEDLRAAVVRGARVPPRLNLVDPAKPVEDFAAANPFRATAVDPKGRAAEDPGAGTTAEAAAFGLVGTLPRVGAWIRDASGNTLLVLKNQEIQGWRLVAVARDTAILERDRRRVPLFLSWAPASETDRLAAAPTPPAGGLPPGAQPPGALPPGIQPAADGKEGTMSRELLNKLLMNPYDELSKVRLVPAFAASGDASGGGQGMRVQNIGNDSLLAQLGVREGDVIQSLNGVPIRNMADVSNAINSLLGGSRMDVSVLREGKSEDLPYAVR